MRAVDVVCRGASQSNLFRRREEPRGNVLRATGPSPCIFPSTQGLAARLFTQTIAAPSSSSQPMPSVRAPPSWLSHTLMVRSSCMHFGVRRSKAASIPPV